VSKLDPSHARRPVLGLSVLAASAVSTLALLIFFGAWMAENRIRARAANTDGTDLEVKGDWWEDGLISICPIH
jgi:hypothetical protein